MLVSEAKKLNMMHTMWYILNKYQMLGIWCSYKPQNPQKPAHNLKKSMVTQNFNSLTWASIQNFHILTHNNTQKAISIKIIYHKLHKRALNLYKILQFSHIDKRKRLQKKSQNGSQTISISHITSSCVVDSPLLLMLLLKVS